MRHRGPDHLEIMEKKMETTIVYWGYIGIMGKKMETTIGILGLYWDNGKEKAFRAEHFEACGLQWG